MNFENEHLLPGQIGHFLVILSWIASLIASIAFYKASRASEPRSKQEWMQIAKGSFFVQVLGTVGIFSIIFFVCSQHYYEYMYAYKHASKELEAKYLLACIWEGQEGSFLLWAIWHALIGSFILLRYKKENAVWQAPVLTIISAAQFFLFFMILGIYIGEVKLGSSPFTLTRNEIPAPIFSRPDYLNLIQDGMGLNVLLRNYWMVIHPPVLFLGFASTIVPFAFAYAGLQTKQYSNWVKPAIPWALFGSAVLGVGIMMGGKWAYESLSFGGYWAWDPVENASLVPWLILVAGLHTMLIHQATGQSLRASYVFLILSFGFVLYSTFLTRTGILGDTSVHAFTEAGKAINIMIGLFVFLFTIPMLGYFFAHYKKIPTVVKEEEFHSREFWMFIGSLLLFLSGIFIIAKTSFPVYNKLFGTKLAAPEDVEFSYNKVMVMVAILLGLLTAITQYFKYKATPTAYWLRKIALPTLLSAVLTAVLVFVYPLQYVQKGPGFLGALYVALFASLYAVVANLSYIWLVMKGNLKQAGAAITHAGFTLMVLGMIITSSNKQIISDGRVNGIILPGGTKDPMSKQTDNPLENLTLIRQVPTRMGSYEVTYTSDSAGHEKGRKFYRLQFKATDTATRKVNESFVVQPDVYLMKDNNMSSNPDTKSYWNKDIFTYISFALNGTPANDTAQFKVTELKVGDTGYYSKGMYVLDAVVKNPSNARYHFTDRDAALMARVHFLGKDSTQHTAIPLIMVDSIGIRQIDDTVFASNLVVQFAGVKDSATVKIGVKESNEPLDFVAVKSYVFPYIALVWVGLIVMAFGFLLSLVRRVALPAGWSALLLVAATAALFYMFLFAN